MNKISNKVISSVFKHLQASCLSNSGHFRALYSLPKELDYDFGKNKERGLQKIADHMLQFVGPIDRAFLILDERASKINADDKVFIVTPDGETRSEKTKIADLFKDKAGEYRIFNNGYKEIAVIYKKEYYLNHYLAILAHEVTHHVLEEHGIRPPLSLDKEIFTDLTAIYLGFGILLCKGYKGGIAFDGGLGYIDQTTVYNATALWFVLNECPITNVFKNFHFIEPERYKLSMSIFRRKLLPV
jgi:hypothetical protein